VEKRSQEFQKRLATLEALRKKGIDPYPNDFKPGAACAEIIERFSNLTREELGKADEVVSLAGRIMALRRFGKASFAHIQDSSGRFQVYLRKDRLGDEAYKLFKECAVGDFIGLRGKVFRTRTDELTVEAGELRLLSKGLSPLPEKWHGLKDVEARYRQRYLDLTVNPKSRDVFIKRTRIVQLIREFLNKRGFIEVETPMMHHIPGGAAARPFLTHHNALGQDLYLRIAPELYLKRLIIGGFERVFEINRNFRNEGLSTQHNPEFTMLEFYQAYARFEDLMELTEQMISSVVMELYGTMKIECQGQALDFTPPWTRVTVKDAIVKHSDADDGIFKHREKAIKFLKGRNPALPGLWEGFSHGKIIAEIFEEVAEPGFVQPTFVTQWPVDVSPLARRNPVDETLSDRFELLIMGKEIANAFSELNDPVDQRERFFEQVKERDAGDQEAHPMDEDFLRALEYGMPPAAGEGIGIDRLVMILTDSPSIRDVKNVL
jgi:lysyl-tRNA synthetase class 2